MLVMSRKKEERIIIGTDIEIKVIGINEGRVKLGIKAPVTTPVHRYEVAEAIAKQNQLAVISAPLTELQLENPLR